MDEVDSCLIRIRQIAAHKHLAARPTRKFGRQRSRRQVRWITEEARARRNFVVGSLHGDGYVGQVRSAGSDPQEEAFVHFEHEEMHHGFAELSGEFVGREPWLELRCLAGFHGLQVDDTDDTPKTQHE